MSVLVNLEFMNDTLPCFIDCLGDFLIIIMTIIRAMIIAIERMRNTPSTISVTLAAAAVAAAVAVAVAVCVCVHVFV